MKDGGFIGQVLWDGMEDLSIGSFWVEAGYTYHKSGCRRGHFRCAFAQAS